MREELGTQRVSEQRACKVLDQSRSTQRRKPYVADDEPLLTKRRRLWFNDCSCVRLRATRRNHVWSYDFVMTRTHDGRLVRMLRVIDELTRECLAIDVERLESSKRAGATHSTVH